MDGGLGNPERHLVRNSVAVFMALAAALTATMAATGWWMRGALFDTDQWVATVTPLTADPAVVAALSEFATTEIIELAQQRSPELLDEQIAALEPSIRETATAIISSEEFNRLWQEVNRAAHTEVLEALEGEASGERVVLDLSPLANRILDGLGEITEELFGPGVRVPEVTPADVRTPTVLRSELENALGVDLPTDFAGFVVYEEEEFENVQGAVTVFERTVLGLTLVAAALAGLALWIGHRRLALVLAFLLALLVFAWLGRGLLGSIQDAIVEDIDGETTQAAVDGTLNVAFRGGRSILGWLMAVGLVGGLAAGVAQGVATAGRRGATSSAAPSPPPSGSAE